jgi:hypothetical protein
LGLARIWVKGYIRVYGGQGCHDIPVGIADRPAAMTQIRERLPHRQEAGHFPDDIDEFGTRRNDDLGILTQELLQGLELAEKLGVLAVDAEFCLSWETTLFADTIPDRFRAAVGDAPATISVPTTGMQQQSGRERFQYPIYRPVQPIRHFVGPVRNLATDVQHFVLPVGGEGGDPLQHFLLRRGVPVPKDQYVAVRRSIVSQVIPCILRSTAICRWKSRKCSYSCHDCLFAYRPKVWFAASSHSIVQAA